MRLDSFIQKTLFLSRKEAKKLIKNKSVKVNDCIVADSSLIISNEATITCNNKVLVHQKFHYFMMNKPSGVVCSRQDALHRTIHDLLPDHIRLLKDLHTIGRLDKDTTGLLLLTDDGKFTHNIISPKKHILKYYQVTLESPAVQEDFLELGSGIMLKGERRKLYAETIFHGPQSIDIIIKEGKYHQVKRMVRYCGNKVQDLHRYRIGDLFLDKALKPGEWRDLSIQEMELLSEGLKTNG